MSGPRRWAAWALALLLLATGVSPTRVALAASPCSFAARTTITIGNGSDIDADVRGFAAGATVHLGRRVRLADATNLAAEHVVLLNGASVFDLSSPDVDLGPGAVVRGTRANTIPPGEPASCATATPTCGGPDVVVGRGDPTRMISPGSYGSFLLDNGAVLLLAAGDYHVCRIQTGRNVAIRFADAGASSLAVLGDVRLENGSRLVDDAGRSAVSLTVGGTQVKIAAGGRLEALVRAPLATLRIGRGATVVGDACVARITTARNVDLGCADATPSTTLPSTTSSSTSTTSTSSMTTSTATTSTSTTTSTATLSTSTTTSTTSTSSSSSSSTVTTLPTTSSTTTSSSSTTLPTTSSTTTVPTSSTTSTTAVTSTTTTSSTSTSSAPTTSTTSTTTSSTTSTTVPGPIVCGATGLDALVIVPYGSNVPALGGVSLDIAYPAVASIPGNGFETEERSTDLTGQNGTLLSVDRDANQNGVDDTLRLVYTLTGGKTFPAGNFASVWFDCTPEALVDPQSFVCTVRSASDAVGNRVDPALVPCDVASLTRHP